MNGLNIFTIIYFNYRSKPTQPLLTLPPVPDLVACWCDVHGPALHGASRRLRGGASVLGDGKPRRRRPLWGHQRRLALFAHIPVGADMAVAQSRRAGHVLRDTVICGHVYGPMRRGWIWQLEGEGNESQEIYTSLFFSQTPTAQSQHKPGINTQNNSLFLT